MIEPTRFRDRLRANRAMRTLIIAYLSLVVAAVGVRLTGHDYAALIVAESGVWVIGGGFVIWAVIDHNRRRG